MESRSIKSAAILFFCLFLGLASTAHAGLKIKEKMASSAKVNILFADGDRFVSSWGNGRGIYSGETMALVSDTNKNYWKGTPRQFAREMCEMTKKVYAEAGFKRDPVPTPEVRVKKLGMTKIAGFKAEAFRILVDQKPYEDIWVNRDPRLKELDRLWKNHGALDRGGNAWACGMDPEREEKIKSSKAYRKVIASGYVLKNVEIQADATESASEIIAVDQVKVPDSRFAIPDNYKRFAKLQDFMRQPQPTRKQSTNSNERQRMMKQARKQAMQAEDPAEKEVSNGETSDATASDRHEAEAARWGEKSSSPEDEPKGVKEKIKKGVKGLFKSLF